MAHDHDGTPRGGEHSAEDSPNPSPQNDAHLDSAQGGRSGTRFDPDVAETGENRAEADDGLTDSAGSERAEEAEMVSKKKQPKVGGVFGDVKSFLLHSPEQRAAYKAQKAQAATGEPVDATDSRAATNSSTSHDTRTATAVAAPTKVSRRARLLGGKRGRAVLLMCLVLFTVVMTVVNTALIVTRPTQGDIEDHVAQAMREEGQSFPSGQAAAWADQVVIDWATWDEDNRDEREVRMAQYLTAGMDSQAGWNGEGTQEVTFTSVNPEPEVLSEHRALVDVDYRLDDGSRRCVTVPVYAYRPDGLTGENVQWAFGLSGNPIPRPCAPRTGAVESPETEEEQESLIANEEVSRELTTSFFPGFFSAWAASDANSLRQYSASGVTTIGLGGAMSSTPPPDIGEVVIMTPRDGEPVEGTVYTATVPVTWTVAGSTSQVSATYDVPMKLDGDRWYVAGEPTATTDNSNAQSGSPAEQISPDDDTDPSQQADESPSPSSDSEGDE